MVTNLYITRHGETLWNTQGRMQGWNDSPLTELGVQQATWLGERLKDIKIDVIYTSPSGRAYSTAEIIKGERELEVIPEDDLREIYLGDWEGLSQEELKEKYPEQIYNFWNKPHLYKSESGESFENVRERTSTFIKRIVREHEGKNILIVTHTMTLKSLMSVLEEKTVENIWDPPFIKQTSLTILEFSKGKMKIILNADTSHHKDQLKNS